MVFRYFNGKEMKKILLLCFLVFSVSLFSQVWLSGYKYRAELVVEGTKDRFPVEQVATVKIHCPAKEDGSDIRITDENGKEIKFFIARKGTENFYEICFPANGKRFFLFCGNPDSTSFESNYRPERGVLLELYRLKGDDVNSWESCKKIIDESVKKENFAGATFRKNIFDATNPITQSGYFLRVYTGYFYLDKKEKISFGTTSSGASFVLVDDNLVASKPGKKWVERFVRPEHSGTIELEPGLHKLVYYHFEFPGWVYAVCAMKKPTDTKFEIINENFFLPVLETKIIGFEKYNLPVCASFRWKNTNYLQRENWELLTFQFTDTSTGKNEIVSWQWDFGDGQTSNEKNPKHTYILKKTYNVTLTVKDSKGNSDSVSMKVAAEQDYGALILNPLSQNEYIEEFSRFNLSKMSEDALFALAGIFNSYDVKEKEFECYKEALKRNIEQQRWRNTAFTAGQIATNIKKYPEAEEIYLMILDKENLPEARLKLGHLYLETQNLDKAENQFKTILDDSQAGKGLKRLATIGLGDTARYKGDKKKAFELYEKATIETDIERKTGIFSQQVSFYLKRNDFPTAIEKLSLWAQELPLCKLNGNWSILYTRAHIGIKDYDRALKEIETFLRICQEDDPYYGWALYWKADIHIKKEEKEKAKTILSELIEKSLQQEIIEMAKSKLKEVEK